MILPLGRSGYVDSAFQRLFQTRGIPYRNIRRRDVDYTNSSVVRNNLLNNKADFRVYCAGYTGKPNVDACELHKVECLQGNAVLPGVIREACE